MRPYHFTCRRQDRCRQGDLHHDSGGPREAEPGSRAATQSVEARLPHPSGCAQGRQDAGDHGSERSQSGNIEFGFERDVRFHPKGESRILIHLTLKHVQELVRQNESHAACRGREHERFDKELPNHAASACPQDISRCELLLPR